MRNLGLIKSDDHGWIYATGNVVVTRHGIEKRAAIEEHLPWLQINNALDSPSLVADFYQEVLSFDKLDPRSTGLIAAVTAGWLSIFAEQLKALHFQIPAIAYIGTSESGKTSFSDATTMLKAFTSESTMTLSSSKSTKIKEVMSICRGGQLIISDLRKEGIHNKGVSAKVLDECVRAITETPGTPGVAIISTEPEILENREIIPSLKNRILWVPMDGLMDTEESNQWTIDLASRPLVGNLMAKILPALLEKINTTFPGDGSQWVFEVGEAFREYRKTHFTPRKQREENMRFLIRYAHGEILDAALSKGLISQELRDTAMDRVTETADWFFQRQILITNPLGKDGIHAIIKKVCSQIRRVEVRIVCQKYGGIVPDTCAGCTYYENHSGESNCQINRTQPELCNAELLLRPNELGIAIPISELPEVPKHCGESSMLLIVRRKMFLETINEVSFDMGDDFQLDFPKLSQTAWKNKLRESCVMGYKLRDGEAEHHDYTLMWPTCINYPNGRSHILGKPDSCLVLKISSAEADMLYTSCQKTGMMFDSPEVDLGKLLANFQFERERRQKFG